MSSDNPYAAPAEDPYPIYDVVPLGGEVWREGKVLVMQRHARLPRRCIKCNTGAGVTMRSRKLYYYPPWIALFILCNLIVLLIVAFVARKKAVVEIGICDTCSSRRMNAILLAWSLVPLAVASLIGGVALSDSLEPPAQERAIIVGILLFIAALLAAAILGILRGQLVVVRSINDQGIRLTGICRAYLAQLPAGFGPVNGV